jgi:hypothetical protein
MGIAIISNSPRDRGDINIDEARYRPFLKAAASLAKFSNTGLDATSDASMLFGKTSIKKRCWSLNSNIPTAVMSIAQKHMVFNIKITSFLPFKIYNNASSGTYHRRIASTTPDRDDPGSSPPGMDAIAMTR